ncbi:MAG: hypothetical protein M1511_12885 [Deltaproteobacteria bacterium]|nr:hypothetical protein [Deltaproteobacteria bacterium]
MERALAAELTNHLGYDKGDSAGLGTGNSRNGHSKKTIRTDFWKPGEIGAVTRHSNKEILVVFWSLLGTPQCFNIDNIKLTAPHF